MTRVSILALAAFAFASPGGLSAAPYTADDEACTVIRYTAGGRTQVRPPRPGAASAHSASASVRESFATASGGVASTATASSSSNGGGRASASSSTSTDRGGRTVTTTHDDDGCTIVINESRRRGARR